MPETVFYHFGCWNNIHDKNKINNPLKAVIRKIVSTKKKRKDNVLFLTVAGDNYYPFYKPDGKRTINLEYLHEGFKYLQMTDIKDRIVLLGNHDMESNESIYSIIPSAPSSHGEMIINDNALPSSLNHPKTCSILEEEMRMTKLTHQCYRKVGNDTLVVFLDSNLYAYERDVSFPTCYATLFPDVHERANGSPGAFMRLLLKRQERLLRSFINNNCRGIKHLIFVAHHPIVSWKVERGNLQFDLQRKHSEFVKMCLEMYSLVKDANYYYLCADTHHYQRGEITIQKKNKSIQIKQFIVGTGGANLDKHPFANSCPTKYPEFEQTTDGYRTKYHVDELNVSYGFLRVAINTNKMPCIRFIPVSIASKVTKTKRRHGSKHRNIKKTIRKNK